jgi:hypothetical protein
MATTYFAGLGFPGHGRGFNVYLPTFAPKGEVFVAVTNERTFGMDSDHFEYTFSLLDVVSPTEYCEEECGVSYNRNEEAEGFDPLQFVAEHYGAVALPRFKGALAAKINQIKATASRQKADSLRPKFSERYGYPGTVGVELPANLSVPEKARFIEQFNQVYGERGSIIDLFALGSLFCVGVTADRKVHFELEEDGLHCSTLGCAVLGITAGELPANEDPDIMFWAVHAAAGMLYPNGDIALLRARGDARIGVSNVTGHRARQITYSGFWGPGEYFETFVRRDKQTFEEMADSLEEWDKRFFRVNEKWYRMTASYASAYLHRNYEFLS